MKKTMFVFMLLIIGASSFADTVDEILAPQTAIIDSYLELKNALVEDNATKAAEAGKKMVEAFKKFDKATVPAAKQKELEDIFASAIEQAEHISNNAGKMAHQREHLAVLSKDINDLIVITGSDRMLYQDFCPMYNNGKGAIWLSASSDIKNPFYGKQMLTCGSVQNKIAAK